jgi:hypothetical protein
MARAGGSFARLAPAAAKRGMPIATMGTATIGIATDVLLVTLTKSDADRDESSSIAAAARS